MIFFFLFSLLILFGSFLKPEKQKYILFLFAFIMFFLLGYRDETVGTDTKNYKTYFEIIEGGYLLSVEIGWIFLNKLVIWQGGNFNNLLVLVAAATVFPIAILLKKHSVNPLLSLFLYYTLYIYFYSFNISRQAIAITVVLLAYVFLIKNKKVWFIVFVIIASLFHTSSLIALPLVFVDRIPDKKSVYYAALAITSGIGLFYTDFLLQYLTRVEGYANYFNRYEIGNVIGNGLYLIVLNAFFLFVLFTIRKRDVSFKIFFCYILLSNLLARIPFNGRVLNFLSIFLILFFPYFINNSKLKEKYIINIIIILYAYVIFFRTFGAGEILPYINRFFY